MLIDSYDQGVIDVLDIYMKDCKDITLVEFGRGNGALAEKYLAEGKKVTIIEDWKQQIYQADEKYYEQLYNTNHEFKIASSLNSQTGPIMAYNNEEYGDFYQNFVVKGTSSKIRAFYELTGLLDRPGRILTVDYNTSQIKEAVKSLNMDITPLIDQGNGKHYMASILNHAN